MYCKQHLRNGLSVARAKLNRVAEQQIQDIIRQEKERLLWRRLNFLMATKRQGRSVRIDQTAAEDGAIFEASMQQQAVGNSIWEEINGKQFHIAEQAPICRGRLKGDFGNRADTAAARAVLDGTYVYYCISSGYA